MRKSKTRPTRQPPASRKPNGVPLVDFHNDPKPRYIPQPRVFCTLHPETGEVQIEVADGHGLPRPRVVKNLETIRRVLMHQAELADAHLPVRIGETFKPGELGADPTEAQIKHWEDHAKRGRKARLQSNCPFCIMEAKAGIAPVSMRKYDTRGNPIKTVTDPSQLGF